MLQHVICVVENTFWTLVLVDRACRPRSQSCPPEFFVDREIQRAIKEESDREERAIKDELRRAKRREKKRAIKEQSARDHDTFAYYADLVTQEKNETSEPVQVETRRQKGRIAELQRKKQAAAAHTYEIELHDKGQRPDGCIIFVTGHGMRGVPHKEFSSTTQLRNLLLDVNGFSRSSDMVVRTSEFKLVPPDRQLRACGVLPGTCIHLGPRKQEKVVCVGRG